METTEKNMEHGEHFNESIVNEVILEDMKKNRIDHMKYLPGMEVLEESDVMDQVISAMNAYDYDKYTEADVRRALAHDNRTPEDFQALLSPAALPLLEEIAQAAQKETRKHFGNSVYMFTPIYIANYCENYCIYCGFNCHNKIRRAKLNAEEIDKEMAAIAKTGLQEILILTGESRAKSDVKYIGEACKIARKYFKVIGLEVYPMNSDEYAHLHECGADYVTVFQETYNSDKYETLHLAGHKRIFPYRCCQKGVPDHCVSGIPRFLCGYGGGHRHRRRSPESVCQRKTKDFAGALQRKNAGDSGQSGRHGARRAGSGLALSAVPSDHDRQRQCGKIP